MGRRVEMLPKNEATKNPMEKAEKRTANTSKSNGAEYNPSTHDQGERDPKTAGLCVGLYQRFSLKIPAITGSKVPGM
jgi:hypothetical protein